MDQEKVKKLPIPETPGCYRYYDKDGAILYVGKAANLRKRVLSYWRESAKHTPAKRAMVEKVAKIEWTEVGSEIEALLLEANLIKKFQPPFNVVLRDDKRHVYIKVTNDEWPRVIATRQIDKEGRYFGPFVSATAVRETIKIISRVWPYGKFITMPTSRTSDLRSRRYPELYGAPSDQAEYKKIIAEIEAFLEGRRKDIEKNYELIIKGYEKKLKDNNDEILLQEVSTMKYRLLNLRKVLAHSNVISIHEKYSADVIELAKILGLPKTPKRIEGYDISNIFGQEAVGSMVVFSDGEPNKSEYRKFKIKKDDSKRSTKGDDTGMLKEVLERRFKHLPNQNEQGWPAPDLIVIDGGKGQLNAGLSVLKKLKLDIQILSISKGEGLRSAKAPDKIFFPGQKDPLKLPLASPALHVVKRVRDEAHRFAIGFHRERKIKRMLKK